jgi:GntP family gluconate:H+ symporter
VVLALAIVTCKVHPVLVPFVVGILTGAVYGYGLVKFVCIFADCFGSIGCIVIIGSIVTMSIRVPVPSNYQPDLKKVFIKKHVILLLIQGLRSFFGRGFKMFQFFIVLITAIVLLVLLIVKLKVHPVLTLFFVGILTGLGFGYGFIETSTTLISGFGSTLGSIGCTIIFGSIIAMCIQDSGAIKSMVNFFIKLSRGKHLELSTSLAAFIMSIPIFGDITQVLTAPIAAFISRRKNISMSAMGTWTVIGGCLTHCLVPPTPGILAVAVLMGADVGMVIVWGLIVAIFTFFIAWGILHKWFEKEWVEPRPDYTVGVEPIESSDYHDLLIKEEGLPNVFIASLPILVPVVLIAGASFANMYLPKGNMIRTALGSLGERNIAMFIGVIISLLFGLSLKSSVITYFKINTGEANTDIGDIMFNKWVDRALKIALLPLMITAMGGAFSAIIKAYPNITQLGNLIAQYHLPSLLMPWIIAAIMMIAVGSQTTASMTAAAIVLPMASGLGLSPLLATLLIGSGVLVGSHVNNSGFWVATQMFNFTTKQGFKYVTFAWSVLGVISFILITILHLLKLI